MKSCWRFLLFLTLVLCITIGNAEAPQSNFSFDDKSNDVRFSKDDIPVDNPSLDIISASYEIKSNSFVFTLTFADIPKIDIETFYLIEVSFNLKSNEQSSVRWQIIHNGLLEFMWDNKTDFNFHDVDSSMTEVSGRVNGNGNTLIFTSDNYNIDFNSFLDDTKYEFRYISVETYHLFDTGNHLDQLDYDHYPVDVTDNITSSENTNTEKTSFYASLLALIPVVLKKRRNKNFN